MKFLKKLLSKQSRVVEITADEEQRIVSEIARIHKIDDWLELHKQAGYQLFGRTREEKYLGYVNFVESLQVNITGIRQPKEEEDEDNGGYESTVE